MAKSLYILDGHYQIYRSFYAPFRELTSPGGEPTKATHVFCNMLLGLIRDRRPDYLSIAFDVGDELTFRRELDPEYKAHREPAPQALHVQAERIISIVQTLGIPIQRLPGFEADDLMATIADRMKDKDLEVYLVSRDKDLEQLITNRVFLFDATKGETIDAAALLEKKGFTPQQAVEIQTLTGDSTDNIPGVPGIGIKTATRLIRQFETVEGVLEHVGELTPKMRERIEGAVDRLPLTRQLVTLRRDAPMEFSLDECEIGRLNYTALLPVFDELGLTRLCELARKLAGASMVVGADGAVAPPPAEAQRSQRGTYQLVNTRENLDVLAASLCSVPAFAFDTETTGLRPMSAELVGLSFCWEAGSACYIPVRCTMGTVLELDEVVAKLKPAFEIDSTTIVGQNLKYDLLMIAQAGIEACGPFFDTRIASFLLDPLENSHSLDNLARRHFNHTMIPISDLIGKGKNQITIDESDLQDVCQYASEDADFTWRLFERLAPRMNGSPLAPLFLQTEMPLVEVLTKMERYGVALDSRLLHKFGDSLADRLAELKKEVHRAAEHEFNIDSPKQLANVLFDEQKLEVVRKTKTGRSTDAETLQALTDKTENPIPPLVLQYRELAKLKSTYADTLPKMISKRTGRLHGSFDQTGTATGRLSSRDPNLQNIPIRTELGRTIRSAFIAPDNDTTLLTADYSQIELRLLAHFSADEAMLEAFRSGQDIHRSVAAQINGVTLDDVTTDQRSRAKAVNFGIIYGQSAFGLARSLGISMGDAKSFIDDYFARYPRIRSFIDQCIATTRDTGYAETILGRRRPVEELRSRNRQLVAAGERIAVNTVVQGSAADLIKRAMVDIHRSNLDSEYGAKMLIQVHDELVFEVPRVHVAVVTDLIRSKMEHAIELEVPIVVDIATGKNWSESK